MDWSDSVYGVIGIAIVVILIGAVAIPTIGDLDVTTPEVKTNEGFDFRMDDVGTVSASLADSVLTVNGETLSPAKMIYVALTPDLALSYIVAGDTPTYYLAYETTTVTLGTSWSFELGSTGAWTLVNGTETTTGNASTSFVYAYDSEGDYGCFSTVKPFVNKGERVVFTLPGGLRTAIAVTEDPTAGSATMDFIGNDAESTQVTWTTSTVERAYVMSEVSYNIDNTDVTPRTIAQLDYIAHVSDEDSTVNMLFSIVPMLLIIAAVMMAVRLLGGRE